MLYKINKLIVKLYKRLPRLKFIYFIIRSFLNKHGIILSNSLSFALILAFIPFAVSIAVLGSVLPFSVNIVNNIEYFYFSKFIPQVDYSLYKQFQFSFNHSIHQSWFGSVSLFISSYSMMFAVEKHINILFGLNQVRKIWRLIVNHTLILLSGIVIIYLLGIFVNWIDGFIEQVSALYYINMLFANMFTMFSILCCYKFMPMRKISWSTSLFCSILATIAFMSVQSYFILSINHLRSEYYLLYGSLFMLPIFLLWVYSEVFIVLFFAHVLFVLEERAVLKSK